MLIFVDGLVKLDIGVFKIQQKSLNQTVHSRIILDCSQFSVDLLACVGMNYDDRRQDCSSAATTAVLQQIIQWDKLTANEFLSRRYVCGSICVICCGEQSGELLHTAEM